MSATPMNLRVKHKSVSASGFCVCENLLILKRGTCGLEIGYGGSIWDSDSKASIRVPTFLISPKTCAASKYHRESFPQPHLLQ